MSKIQRLKEAMEQQGWDPEDGRELAKASGVHITLVRRYLAGAVRIGPKNAPAIAAALGLTVVEVLYEADAGR